VVTQLPRSAHPESTGGGSGSSGLVDTNSPESFVQLLAEVFHIDTTETPAADNAIASWFSSAIAGFRRHGDEPATLGGAWSVCP
jgi:hypothetical protein